MMKFFLLLLAALAVQAKETRRFPLSSPLPNSVAEGAYFEEKANSYKTADSKEIKIITSTYRVSLDEGKYRLTTLTYKSPIGADTYKPSVSEGCIETRIWSKADLSRTDIKEKSIIIIREKVLAADLAKLIEAIKSKHVTVAFLKSVDPISDEIRILLKDNAIAFIENLEIEKIGTTKPETTYYAFKYVFLPFANSSSIYLTTDTNPKLHRDLVDLTIFDADDRLATFCKTAPAKIVEISQKIVSDVFPIDKSITRPSFVDVSGKKWLEFSPYIATHIEGPVRLDQTKANISKINEASFYAPCLNYKLPASDSKPSPRITKEMLLTLEKTLPITAGSIIFLNTEWSAKWDKPEPYIKDYPILDIEAAKLLAERKVAAVGIDTLSLDAPDSYIARSWLASSNIPVLLNIKLSDFPSIPEGKRAQCVVSYLRSSEGTGATATVFVLPELEQTPLKTQISITVPQNTKDEPKKAAASSIAPSMALLAVIAAFFY